MNDFPSVALKAVQGRKTQDRKDRAEMYGPSEEQDLSAFDPSEQQALATYNHAAEERRFLQGHQWQITNYALIAFAALTAAPDWLESDCLRWWASVGAILLISAATVQAARLLANIGLRLNVERQRLSAARSRLRLMRDVQSAVRVRSKWFWQLGYWKGILRAQHQEDYGQDTDEQDTSRDPLLNLGLFISILAGWIIGGLINFWRIPSLQDLRACISQSAFGGPWPTS